MENPRCSNGHKTTIIWYAGERKCKGFYCGKCQEQIPPIGREKKLGIEPKLKLVK